MIKLIPVVIIAIFISFFVSKYRSLRKKLDFAIKTKDVGLMWKIYNCSKGDFPKLEKKILSEILYLAENRKDFQNMLKVHALAPDDLRKKAISVIFKFMENRLEIAIKNQNGDSFKDYLKNILINATKRSEDNNS